MNSFYNSIIISIYKLKYVYFYYRYLGHLKKKVKQKARVEGSICQAYIVEESSIFFSYYFDDHVKLPSNTGPRNDDGKEDSKDISLSIFQKRWRPAGKWKELTFQTLKEFSNAKTAVLLNCEELSDILEYVFLNFNSNIMC